jgi:hypothetical protein
MRGKKRLPKKIKFSISDRRRDTMGLEKIRVCGQFGGGRESIFYCRWGA